MTLGFYNADGGYMVNRQFDLAEDERTDRQVLPTGTSLRDAIRAATAASAASSSPAGTLLGRAFAVMQAEHGVFELRGLTFQHDGVRYPAFVDGPMATEWGVDRVEAATSGAMLALVGTRSWIDLSAAAHGVRRPLPVFTA